MSAATTRGRITGETQAAAIARAVSLLPQSSLILAALDRVVESEVFRSSKRGREFLRYIVEQALAGELNRLKERCIGAALFGRAPDYDTGTDSVVRVTANEVRKRLALYYASPAAAGEAIRFELPAGSYIPEIHCLLTERDERPVEKEPALTTAPVVASAPLPSLAPVFAEPRATVVPPPGTRRRHVSLVVTIAIGGWVVALVLAFLFLRTAAGTKKYGLSNSAETVQARALRVLPWVALFDGGKTPRVVLADTGMGSLRAMYPLSTSIEEYANRRFLTPPDALKPELVFPYREIVRGKYTSLADVHFAADYAPLAVAAGQTPAIHSARELNLADFREGDNFILLGGSSSNPWVQLFEDQTDFVLQFAPAHATKVLIRHPRKGEPHELLTSVTSGNTGQAYATLSLVNGLDGRGRVLIAQGTNMEGTQLAASLALNPDGLSAELRRCGLNPANPGGRFEILFKLNTTAGSASASSILATRCQGN